MRQAIIEHRQRAKGVVAAPFLVLDNQRPCAAIRFIHVAAMAPHPVRRFIEQAGGFVLRYGDVGVGRDAAAPVFVQVVVDQAAVAILMELQPLVHKGAARGLPAAIVRARYKVERGGLAGQRRGRVLARELSQSFERQDEPQAHLVPRGLAAGLVRRSEMMAHQVRHLIPF